jgi:AraC-like DNA-binding protein
MLETVFRSEDYPVADRFEAWCEKVNQSPTPYNVVTSEHSTDFRAQIERLDMGTAQVSVLSYPSLRAQRTPALVRRSDHEIYQLALNLRGIQGRQTECGREVSLRVGELALYDTSHPCTAWAVADQHVAQAIIVDIPRSALALPAAKVDRLQAMTLPGDTGMGALVSQFLIRVVNQSSFYQPQDTSRLGTVITDLITVFLAHDAGIADLVAPESHAQALLAGVYAFIERNLGNADLSPQAIAAARHISVRYLHLLFESQDTTVAAWIRHRRLERCRRDLAEPLLAGRPIRAIAARWGFLHPQEFSRAFRGNYGISPSEYRRNLGAAR